MGTGPETTDPDEQLDRVRGERHAAANAQEYEQAWWLRDREKELPASKAARHEQRAAGHLPARWPEAVTADYRAESRHHSGGRGLDKRTTGRPPIVAAGGDVALDRTPAMAGFGGSRHPARCRPKRARTAGACVTRSGILLIEDHGPGPSSADSLTGDRSRLRADLASYAKALGSMHAWSIGRPSDLRLGTPPWPDAMARGKDAFHNAAVSFGPRQDQPRRSVGTPRRVGPARRGRRAPQKPHNSATRLLIPTRTPRTKRHTPVHLLCVLKARRIAGQQRRCA